MGKIIFVIFSTVCPKGKTSLTKGRKKEKEREKRKERNLFSAHFFEKTEQKASFRPKTVNLKNKRTKKCKKNERNERF
jgi:hypothetical protein